MSAALLPAAALKAFATGLGFAAVGVAAAQEDRQAAFVMHERISLGMYDGLDWFSHERVDRATDPDQAFAGAASVITLAAPYRTEYRPGELVAGLRGRVARYAWGRDYHRVLEKRLKLLTAFVASEYGGLCRGLVDYGPLAERAFAARAGIGWFGKSTNVLLPGVGSWVLLAELITNVPIQPDPPLVKTCGSCTRCATACPTGAIVGPYAVDNRRCISFQTIENKGWIPRELRPLMGDWVFGCDLCQDVCPVGSGRSGDTLEEFRPANLDAALPELSALLALDDQGFRERFQGRAVMRAGRAGLARNACVALGNIGSSLAVPPLARSLRADPAPTVRGHAAWALGRIGCVHAEQELQSALACEQDAAVRREIGAALSEGGQGGESAGRLGDPMGWLEGPWRRASGPLNVV